MLSKPNPTPLQAPIDESSVEDHRSVFCCHYDSCLDEALRCLWRGWTCASCRLFTTALGAGATVSQA